MTKSELLSKIKEIGFPSDFYSIDDDKQVMGIYLKRTESGTWIVYALGDRGNHDYQREFKNEDEACDYMFELVMIDANMLSAEIKNKYKEIYLAEGK